MTDHHCNNGRNLFGVIEHIIYGQFFVFCGDKQDFPFSDNALAKANIVEA
jgi:hypothetical protein